MKEVLVEEIKPLAATTPSPKKVKKKSVYAQAPHKFCSFGEEKVGEQLLLRVSGVREPWGCDPEKMQSPSYALLDKKKPPKFMPSSNYQWKRPGRLLPNMSSLTRRSLHPPPLFHLCEFHWSSWEDCRQGWGQSPQLSLKNLESWFKFYFQGGKGAWLRMTRSTLGCRSPLTLMTPTRSPWPPAPM